jgi:putative flippase GtrA
MSNIQPSTRYLRNPLDGPILAIASRFGDKSKEVERFLKFAVVGFFGAAVDFGTTIVLQATVLPPVNQQREAIPANVFLATSIAFFAAVISNFIWNRFWTYPDSRSRSMRRQLVQFTFISFIGWAARTVWITASYHTLGQVFMPIALPVVHLFRPTYIPSYAGEGKLGTLVAQFIGVIVVMFWNFFANRYWTYNDVSKT